MSDFANMIRKVAREVFKEEMFKMMTGKDKSTKTRRTVSEETKKKMREAQQARWAKAKGKTTKTKAAKAS